VRVLWKEDRERSGRHRQPDPRRGIKKDDVLRLVEVAARLARRERQPPDLFEPVERQLDVDVAAMRFEACPFAAAPVLPVDQHEQAIAVDLVASGCQRGEAGLW
jgi:hypothetical protein